MSFRELFPKPRGHLALDVAAPREPSLSLLSPDSISAFGVDDEQRSDQACRHYSIDGPGLQDRGGDVWVRMGPDPVIVDYEIDLPDESSMQSGKMLLVGTEKLSAEAWKLRQESALDEPR